MNPSVLCHVITFFFMMSGVDLRSHVQDTTWRNRPSYTLFIWWWSYMKCMWFFHSRRICLGFFSLYTIVYRKSNSKIFETPCWLILKASCTALFVFERKRGTRASECGVKVTVNMCMCVTFFAPLALALSLSISYYFQGACSNFMARWERAKPHCSLPLRPKPFNEVINPANRKLSPLCNAEVHNSRSLSAVVPQQTV